MQMIVRLAHEGDIDGLFALAETAGTGMTTVPNSRDAIAERVAQSVSAMNGTGKAGPKDSFFFVLEGDGEVLGMAAIFPALGADRPFYSYRISKVAAAAPELGMQAASELLYLCNDFHGYVEIGTLLVSDKARGTGAGRLLSLSRFLYMQTVAERLSEHVMAEIRGRFREDGSNPFWDAIASKFFKMSFQEADVRSAHDFRFIADLMPKFPIYTELLDEETREAMGQPHSTSAAAMNMLTKEGFQFTNCIDIFDGGPSIECPMARIRTIEQSAQSVVRIQDAPTSEGNSATIVAVPDGKSFRSILLPRDHRDGSLFLSQQEADLLQVSSGADIVTSPLKGRRR